jgi:hypothetical protein
VANAGQKQYALQGQPNVWTNNNATLMKSFADTSTYQAISVDGDKLTYKSVATWARAGGQSPFQPGDTVDEFTITKYDDGAKWVTEPGVAVPGDDVPAEGRTRPSSEPFDDDSFGDVVWDDDFSTDRLAQYATRAGNEALPALSVDTAAGVLKATATSRAWGNIVPPVEGGERWALIVEPKSFAGTGASEDSMFVGASADNQNMWMNWYNNSRKETGYDFAASTGGKTVGQDSTGLSVDQGDRVAFVVDHGEVSSWIEENDTWRRYNVGLAGYALQPGVLESWKPTLGLRLDPGTIAIDRITVLAELPAVPVTPAPVTFADQLGVRNDTYTVPTTEGVEYVVGGAVVAAGTYPGSGTVTVTARASGDAPIADGATTTWTHTFTTDAVTPGAVTFTDQVGVRNDTYTVPASAGVEYVVGGAVVAAGTYPGSGTVTVTARASGDGPIADGATTTWSHTFATDRASLAITLTATGGTYGTAATVTGTLASASGPVSGPVSITVDGRSFGTATAAAGRFAVELDRTLAAGTHQVTVAYAGDDLIGAATGAVDVTVAQATPKVTLKVTPRKAKARRTRLTAVVTVTLPGSTVQVSGTVKVKVGGRTLTATVRDGRARLKLPAITKRGKVRVQASYVGSASIAAGPADAVTVRVTR